MKQAVVEEILEDGGEAGAEEGAEGEAGAGEDISSLVAVVG